jgi:hypothetical protein
LEAMRRGARVRSDSSTFRFEDPPHVEAGDVEDGVKTGSGFAVLKLGFKAAGTVKLKVVQHGTIELSWSSANGRTWHSQSICLTRFKADGRDYICLNCPRCGRPRKQLFLVPSRARGRGQRSYHFLCANEECSGVQAKRKQRSRNLEKQGESSAGWAWKAPRGWQEPK